MSGWDEELFSAMDRAKRILSLNPIKLYTVPLRWAAIIPTVPLANRISREACFSVLWSNTNKDDYGEAISAPGGAYQFSQVIEKDKPGPFVGVRSISEKGTIFACEYARHERLGNAEAAYRKLAGEKDVLISLKRMESFFGELLGIGTQVCDKFNDDVPMIAALGVLDVLGARAGYTKTNQPERLTHGFPDETFETTGALSSKWLSNADRQQLMKRSSEFIADFRFGFGVPSDAT